MIEEKCEEREGGQGRELARILDHVLMFLPCEIKGQSGEEIRWLDGSHKVQVFKK